MKVTYDTLNRYVISVNALHSLLVRFVFYPEQRLKNKGIPAQIRWMKDARRLAKHCFNDKEEYKRNYASMRKLRDIYELQVVYEDALKTANTNIIYNTPVKIVGPYRKSAIELSDINLICDEARAILEWIITVDRLVGQKEAFR